MVEDSLDPVLEPLSDLYEAQTMLSAWVTAVHLQGTRLRQKIVLDEMMCPDALGDAIERGSLKFLADAMMFVVACNQVAEVSNAVLRQVPSDLLPDVQDAIQAFELACPHRRQLRDAVVHYADYLKGKGHQQKASTSPEAWFAATDDSKTLVYSIDADAPPLVLDVDQMVDAAATLDRTVAVVLESAQASRAQGHE